MHMRGPVLSPRSAAKTAKIHYCMKDREVGFRCLICNRTGQDISVIKSSPCHSNEVEPSPPPSQSDLDERKARQLQLQELEALKAEGDMLEELLAHQVELMQLEDLEAEEAALEAKLKAEEEADLLQAKIQSLATVPAKVPKQTWTPLREATKLIPNPKLLDAAEDLAKRSLNFDAMITPCGSH